MIQNIHYEVSENTSNVVYKIITLSVETRKKNGRVCLGGRVAGDQIVLV